MVHRTDAKLQESLSALMDNEASELELHRLLKALETDQDLQQSWSNYHLASSSIKGNLAAHLPINLSANISASIASEPTHGRLKNSSKVIGLWQAAGKLAVAASVAAAVLISTQQYMQVEGDLGSVAEAPNQSSPAGVVPEGFQALDLTTRTVSISDAPASFSRSDRGDVVYVPSVAEQQIQNKAIEEHLNQLMLEHAENATQNSAQGLLPYARIAPEASSIDESVQENATRTDSSAKD